MSLLCVHSTQAIFMKRVVNTQDERERTNKLTHVRNENTPHTQPTNEHRTVSEWTHYFDFRLDLDVWRFRFNFMQH